MLNLQQQWFDEAKNDDDEDIPVIKIREVHNGRLTGWRATCEGPHDTMEDYQSPIVKRNRANRYALSHRAIRHNGIGRFVVISHDAT